MVLDGFGWFWMVHLKLWFLDEISTDGLWENPSMVLDGFGWFWMVHQWLWMVFVEGKSYEN